MVASCSSAYYWRRAAASLLFPHRYCLNCGALSPEKLLCPDCRKMQLSLRRCPGCAAFIPDTEAPHYMCASCRRSAPAYDGAIAALPYRGYFRDQLLAFKFKQKTGLQHYLGLLMFESWQRIYGDLSFDVIVPVPAYIGRSALRGYDQSLLLARVLANLSGIPLGCDLLSRVKDTPALAGLSRRQRAESLKGAFAAAPCNGLTVLLTDDIFTTGATADQAAAALLRQGAGAVYVLTAAAGYDL